MRVLILSAEPPYPPTHGGARLKLYRLLEYLAQFHELTLLTLLESPQERELLPNLQRYCRNIMAFDRPHPHRSLISRFRNNFYRLAYDRTVAKAIMAELGSENYDLVHVDTAYMAVYTRHLGHTPRLMAAHDAISEGIRSHLAVPQPWRERLRTWHRYRLALTFERREYSRYSACVVVTERDRMAIRALCPRLPVQIIPNGIDLNYFSPVLAPPTATNRLVFTGTMDFGPNIDAAKWFVAKVLPVVQIHLPATECIFAGRNPAADVLQLQDRSGVKVTGFVPDLRPLLNEATLYICSLRTGCGMKNKMLEAMAMGKAIVTTSEGAAGIGGQDGHEYIIADDARDFSQSVIALLTDPERRLSLGTAARAFVEANYSWEKTGRLMHELYQTVGATRMAEP